MAKNLVYHVYICCVAVSRLEQISNYFCLLYHNFFVVVPTPTQDQRHEFYSKSFFFNCRENGLH
jgi:hypothetical protein